MPRVYTTPPGPDPVRLRQLPRPALIAAVCAVCLCIFAFFCALPALPH